MILRLFPDAQIINVVRDGRACVASLKEMSWNRHDIYGTLAIWARAVDDARDAARRLDRSQWHQVRYEELVADPPAVLTEMCAFLGEEYDPAMAEPSALAEVAVPEVQDLAPADPFAGHHPAGAELAAAPHRRRRSRCARPRSAAASTACGYELSGVPRSRPTDAAALRDGGGAAPARRANRRAPGAGHRLIRP